MLSNIIKIQARKKVRENSTVVKKVFISWISPEILFVENNLPKTAVQWDAHSSCSCLTMNKENETGGFTTAGRSWDSRLGLGTYPLFQIEHWTWRRSVASTLLTDEATTRWWPDASGFKKSAGFWQIKKFASSQIKSTLWVVGTVLILFKK